MINKLNPDLYKISRAGTKVDSSEIDLKVKYAYTPISWLLFTLCGTTRMPKAIKFYCKKSEELFEEVTDQKRIQHYMRFRPK